MANIVTGLDIGTGSFKMLQLKSEGSGLKVIKSAGASIPMDVPPAERSQRLKELLKKTLAENNFRITGLIACLPRRLAAVKFVTLPSHNQSEIKEMVNFEAEKQIPFPLEEAELDYQVLGENAKGGSDVLLVAIQRLVIDQQLSALRECGLKPNILELSSMALFNAFNYLHGISAKEVVLLIDIGFQMTEINIVKNGRIHFSRNAPVSAHGFTLALQREMSIDYVEAESLKRKYGVEYAEAEPEYRERYSTVSKGWAGMLHNEIRRSLDAFRAEVKEGSVHSILLSGGGARLKGLRDVLGEHFGVEVRSADLKNLNEEHGPEWTVALGAALRGMKPNPVEINLLPLSYKMEKKVRREKALRLGMVAGAGLVIVAGVWAFTSEIRRNWDDVDRLKSEIEKLGVAVSEVDKLRQEEKVLKEYGWAGASSLEILLVLSKFAPPDIRLTNFRYRKNEWLYLTGLADSRPSVNNLISILQKTGWFETVEEKYSQIAGDKIDFGIECKAGVKKK